jgi:hypothetical protein
VLVGVMVVAYASGIGPATATVRRLLGPPAVTEVLLARACALAAARRCTVLELAMPPGDADREPELRAAGWTPGPRVLVREVE